MRLICPHCGPRDLVEFSYHGDAEKAQSRPAPDTADQAIWNGWVYDRCNPAGSHAEIWQHSGGCRMFLAVQRDTVSHAVTDTRALERAS